MGGKAVDTAYVEDGVAVISVSHEEAFATKYSIEAFVSWYDKTYELTTGRMQALYKECERVELDQDGIFIDAAALHMSKKDVDKYRETHANCECIDWNNRRFGQWLEDDGKTLIFMSYRDIIRNAVAWGETYVEPVMVMSV